MKKKYIAQYQNSKPFGYENFPLVPVNHIGNFTKNIYIFSLWSIFIDSLLLFFLFLGVLSNLFILSTEGS